jgi:hypothetical protein
MNFTLVALAALLSVVVVQSATLIIARRVGRYNVQRVLLAYTIFRTPPAQGQAGLIPPPSLR